LSILCVAQIFVMRRKFVQRSEVLLAAQPADAAALKRWRAWHLITYWMCQAVAFYGILLRFLGFAFFQVAPFYLAGFILLVFYVPRAPSNTIG
jgi:hypothetical protein